MIFNVWMDRTQGGWHFCCWGHRGHVPTTLQVPHRQPLLLLPQGTGALHPIHPLGESLPSQPSVCPPRPQIHDTPSELASANKRAGSLTSTCLPVLSVCLSSGPKANGRNYPNTPTLAPSSSQASFANLCGFSIKSP